MKIDLSTLALVGVVGYLAWRWSRAEVPNATQAGHNLFLSSSLGDLTTKGLDAWGSSWSWDPYSAEEAAKIAEVADNLNRQVGYGAGSWGTL